MNSSLVPQKRKHSSFSRDAAPVRRKTLSPNDLQKRSSVTVRHAHAPLPGLETTLQECDRRITALLDETAQLKAHAAQLETRLNEERKVSEEKLALLNKAQQKLSDAFKALSADALKSSNQSFLELAKATLEMFHESAKADLENRQRAIGNFVTPLRESLDKVDTKIAELEKSRAGAYAGLVEQVKSLATTQLQLQIQTGNLVKALRAPTVRGRWREIQLRTPNKTA